MATVIVMATVMVMATIMVMATVMVAATVIMLVVGALINHLVVAVMLMVWAVVEATNNQV